MQPLTEKLKDNTYKQKTLSYGIKSFLIRIFLNGIPTFSTKKQESSHFVYYRLKFILN